jgi:hypothetical protein
MLLTAIVVFCPFALRAQDSTTVPLGAQLRVRLDSVGPWQQGKFGGVVSDTLLLRARSSSPLRRFPLVSLQEIDMRERDGAKRRSNAVLGVILGVAGGALVLHLGIRRCEAHDHNSEGPPCGIAYAALPLFTIAGAGVGGIIGAAWPAHRWRQVSVIAPAAH